MGLHGIAAHGLANFERREHANGLGSDEQTQQQSRHGCQHCAQRQILKDAQETKLGRQTLQPLEQHQQHVDSPQAPCAFSALACID